MSKMETKYSWKEEIVYMSKLFVATIAIIAGLFFILIAISPAL